MCRFAQYKTLLIPFFFTEQNSTWSRIRSGSWRTEMMCLRSGKLMNQFYVNEPSAFETPFILYRTVPAPSLGWVFKKSSR